MFEDYKAAPKWLVIGDILEQGKNEQREHKKIANLLNKTNFERIILMGRRINRYTKPRLSQPLNQRTKIISLENPKQVLQYLHSELVGGETILFKGAGYMEVTIEALLQKKEDAKLLVRREPVWRRRLARLGL